MREGKSGTQAMQHTHKCAKKPEGSLFLLRFLLLYLAPFHNREEGIHRFVK